MHKKDTDKLFSNAKTLEAHPFDVPLFLQSPHVQHLFSGLIPQFSTLIAKQERRYIQLPDGSQLAADCWLQKKSTDHATVVTLGGLEGYSGLEIARFRKGIGYKAYQSGYNVIHLRQRAEGDIIHLTKSLGYVAEDLPIALQQFVKWGFKKLFLVGFSAGGYTLLLTLGKLGAKAQKNIFGAVAISAYLNNLDTWQHIEKSILYDWLLRRYHKNLIKRRVKIDPAETWDLKKLKNIKTKRQWAETYMHNWGYPETFTTFEEMNAKTDALQFISHIQVPTLIIHSLDDPIAPGMSFTQKAVQQNSFITTLLTKHGGHCGFVTLKKKYGDIDGHWDQNRAMEFIRLLDEKR